MKPKTTTLLYDSKGRVLRKEVNTLFAGYVYDEEIQLKQISPTIRWNNAPIPYQLWCEIVAFMKWSQKTTKAEAHLALFFNIDRAEWAAWAFPQSGVGMTVKTLPDDPLYVEDRKQFGRGWIMAGSVHHHCEGGAFQSGVDKADETDKEGIHITIGKTSSDVIETHVRIIWNEASDTCLITDVVSLPAEITAHMPSHLTDQVAKLMLHSPSKVQFNEVWKERLIEEKKPITTKFTENTAWYGRTTFITQQVNGPTQNCRQLIDHLTKTHQIDHTHLFTLLSFDDQEANKLKKEDALLRINLMNIIRASRYNIDWFLGILEAYIKVPTTNQPELGL